MSAQQRSSWFSLRGLLAALATLTGALLLLVTPGRSHDWLGEALALAIVGVALGTLGLATIASKTRWTLIALAVLTTLVVLWLIVTRAVGYPFGPWSQVSPSMGTFEILVLVLGLINLALVGGALLVDVEHLGAAGLRFDNIAPLALVIIALPGLAVSSWIDDGSQIVGSNHEHSQTLSLANTPSMPGMDHSHMIEVLSSEQRAQLGRQMVDARTAALQYPTLAMARSAGWVAIGSYVSGAGQMLVDPTAGSREIPFDPSIPQGLLFASLNDSAPIVGVQYNAWTNDGSTPDGFVAQDNMWHLHPGTCEISETTSVVYDKVVTGAACSKIDAQLTDKISWMIRAWVVPGWENPQGPLAHDNPLLQSEVN